MPHCQVSNHFAPPHRFLGQTCLSGHATNICNICREIHLFKQAADYGSKITCMQCSKVISEEDIKSMSTQEVYAKYLDFKIKAKVEAKSKAKDHSEYVFVDELESASREEGADEWVLIE